MLKEEVTMTELTSFPPMFKEEVTTRDLISIQPMLKEEVITGVSTIHLTTITEKAKATDLTSIPLIPTE